MFVSEGLRKKYTGPDVVKFMYYCFHRSAQGLTPPTASVSVSPHGLLYSGETVTLQCDISIYTGWTYWWYRKDQLQSPGSPSKTITTLSDQVSQYQCQGRRTNRPQSSQRSDYLHISVTGEFTINFTSSDQQDVLTGDSVTLTCTVESSGWRFYWYKHKQDSEPVKTTSGSSYTLSQVRVSDGGQYRCRAGRGDPVYYTQYSEPVHIQVTGESKHTTNTFPVRPVKPSPSLSQTRLVSTSVRGRGQAGPNHHILVFITPSMLLVLPLPRLSLSSLFSDFRLSFPWPAAHLLP
uniref:Ig-like domain-containing protein n=1 Tax=Esox lucius TaxID=8010 RepID=A0A6Q2YML6_ESOLU